MAKIAFLGLGAMGARMAANLVKAGHELVVWNRTPERTAPLVALGAAAASSPRDAVAGVDFAIAMVRDDAASRGVWLDPKTGALAALPSHAIAIESSTLSPEWVREWVAACAGSEIACLDAPVAGSRPQAESGQLIYLVGGKTEVFGRAEPILAAMGGAVHHTGGNGSGAALKLAVNTLLGIQVAAMAEILGGLRRAGVDLKAAIEVMGATPVCSPTAKASALSMLADAFPPLFPVELIEKDLGYALSAAGQKGDMPITAAARDVFAAGIRAGYGEENMTSVARLYRPTTVSAFES